MDSRSRSAWNAHHQSAQQRPPRLSPGTSPRIDLFLVLAIYTVAHGLILLDTGIYYDDWLIYRAPRECHRSFFKPIPPLEVLFWLWLKISSARGAERAADSSPGDLLAAFPASAIEALHVVRRHDQSSSIEYRHALMARRAAFRTARSWGRTCRPARGTAPRSST
jgi:hypothetical protein